MSLWEQIKLIKENLNLDKVIDLKKWVKLQDSLSLVTKAAIIIVDYKEIQLQT